MGSHRQRAEFGADGRPCSRQPWPVTMVSARMSLVSGASCGGLCRRSESTTGRTTAMSSASARPTGAWPPTFRITGCCWRGILRRGACSGRCVDGSGRHRPRRVDSGLYSCAGGGRACSARSSVRQALIDTTSAGLAVANFARVSISSCRRDIVSVMSADPMWQASTAGIGSLKKNQT